jgi:enamine deaminase RidA (YjgF/YER057c/UK114 family)
LLGVVEMMSRFTEKAQEALQRAQQLMFSKKHTQLDVEHIFLALLQQRNSLPTQIVVRLGGNLEEITLQLDRALNAMQDFSTANRGSATGYITLRANRVLQGAAEEADRLNDEFISTEHLFLAIAGERGGQTGRILMQADIDQEKIHTLLAEMRGSGELGQPGSWGGYSRREDAINPALLVKPVGYSHGIAASGRFLFLAGQVAIDVEGKLVAPGDVVGQYRQVLRNLQAVVEEAGGQMRDIAKMTIYVKDRDDYKAHLEELGRVHKDFFGSYYPATALVEISRFFEEGVLVEIEGIAVLA